MKLSDALNCCFMAFIVRPSQFVVLRQDAPKAFLLIKQLSCICDVKKVSFPVILSLSLKRIFAIEFHFAVIAFR